MMEAYPPSRSGWNLSLSFLGLSSREAPTHKSQPSSQAVSQPLTEARLTARPSCEPKLHAHHNCQSCIPLGNKRNIDCILPYPTDRLLWGQSDSCQKCGRCCESIGTGSILRALANLKRRMKLSLFSSCKKVRKKT